MARDEQILLHEGQRLAFCNPYLQLNKIEPGYRLCHGMFNLQPRVHFHEPEAIGPQALRTIHDKFNRARAGVIHSLCRRHGSSAHRRTKLICHARRRRFLDHFLMAALQRTIALEQMHNIAKTVAEYLHLDMTRRENIFFDQHTIIAE